MPADANVTLLTSQTITTAAQLSQAFDAARYEVVITAYRDAAVVSKQLEALPSKPDARALTRFTTLIVLADSSLKNSH